jgi:hypothetical protein
VEEITGHLLALIRLTLLDEAERLLGDHDAAAIPVDGGTTQY